jgi:hypothetical protein
MPPARKKSEKKSDEEIVEAAIESPQDKLENRVAVLEQMVAKLYGHHYGGIYKLE